MIVWQPLPGHGDRNNRMRYEPNLKTFDDYKIIVEQDLRDIVSIVKSLSPM
jgi:hypothetical protein